MEVDVKRLMIAVVASLIVSTGADALAVTPVKVLGTSKDEYNVAKAAGWLAYSQSSTNAGGRTAVFAQPDGDTAFRVSEKGTFAIQPNIDLANATLATSWYSASPAPRTARTTS